MLAEIGPARTDWLPHINALGNKLLCCLFFILNIHLFKCTCGFSSYVETRNPVTFLDCLFFTWLALVIHQNSTALITYVGIEWTASPSSIQLTYVYVLTIASS